MIKNKQANEAVFTLYNPNTLYNPISFAYSHLAEVKLGHQRILHVAGQGGENVYGTLASEFEAQIQQAFHNIILALQHAHASLFDIAVLRILVIKHSHEKHQILIKEMQKLWKDHKFPVCTLIPVTCLAIDGMLIEIEATAYCL